MQKYASDIQNELNEFNKENVKYQAILQEYIQEAQLLDQNEARKIQKYQAEVQTYQATINKEVQEYLQNLAGDIQTWPLFLNFAVIAISVTLFISTSKTKAGIRWSRQGHKINKHKLSCFSHRHYRISKIF